MEIEEIYLPCKIRVFMWNCKNYMKCSMKSFFKEKFLIHWTTKCFLFLLSCLSTVFPRVNSKCLFSTMFLWTTYFFVHVMQLDHLTINKKRIFFLGGWFPRCNCHGSLWLPSRSRWWDLFWSQWCDNQYRNGKKRLSIYIDIIMGMFYVTFTSLH